MIKKLVTYLLGIVMIWGALGCSDAISSSANLHAADVIDTNEVVMSLDPTSQWGKEAQIDIEKDDLLYWHMPVKHEIVTMLHSKYAEWSAVNDDVAGVMCLPRLGVDNEVYNDFTPIISSDNIEHYTSHYYDGRRVKGGSTQILCQNSKQKGKHDWVLIFGYRLGIDSYLNTDFSKENGTLHLLLDGNTIQFTVFAAHEVELKERLDYVKGTIPDDVTDIIDTMEMLSSDQWVTYHKQITNLGQPLDFDNAQIAIICSDVPNDCNKMAVLYAYA